MDKVDEVLGCVYLSWSISDEVDNANIIEGEHEVWKLMSGLASNPSALLRDKLEW